MQTFVLNIKLQDYKVDAVINSNIAIHIKIFFTWYNFRLYPKWVVDFSINKGMYSRSSLVS